MSPSPRRVPDTEVDAARRELVREAACMAGMLAATASLPSFAAQAIEVRRYARTMLVDRVGEPFRARSLVIGEPLLFNYPFLASPVFLLRLDRAVGAIDLQTEARQSYSAPAGVGPGGAIVAYSAICAHKLMYPTPQLSFIGVRKGFDGEPAQVVHCCGDNSRYDPAQGARVLAGPAPQPLAAVLLEWEAGTDRLYAAGVLGGEMFKPFFEKYGFKLETELGAKARAPVGATAVVQPAATYSRQWQTCRA